MWIKVEVERKCKPVELTKVLYMSDLAKDLFSVCAVVEKGVSVVFKEDKCLILNSVCLPLNKSMHGADSAVA